jgi:hypothetical protein
MKKLKKIIRKIRLVFKGSIASFCFKALHKKGFKTNESLLICGSIRSGSTWLAELISELDGHIQVFEPMHPEYVPLAGQVIPTRNMYVPQKAAWPEGVSFFEKVMSGKQINFWTASQMPLNKIFKTKRIVVKVVRANLMLDWITHNVDILPPALVIRHPCAIIASQLNKGWPPSRKLLLENSYLDKYPDIRLQCAALSKPEELAALAWCIRYHAPLSAEKPYGFILICYEQLVRNGEQELKKLFDAWQLPLDEKVINRLNVPSDTVENDSQIVSGKDPLAGWKNKLSSQQVDSILAVLTIFKLDFYSHDLEPHYEKLNSFGAQ